MVKAGYKQTEVGIIPEDWDVVPLGGYVEINSGESPSKYNFVSQGIPYFKVEQLNNDRKYQRTTSYYFREGKTVQAGSLIFPKRGASILLNKIRILESDSFMDTNLMTLTTNDVLETEYLFYTLEYYGLWKVADTTSIPQINNKHIIPFLIPYPTTNEQREIAAVLSDVDALIAALDKLIAKKRAIKTGTMQVLLSGEKRLPGFGNGRWEEVRFGNLGNTYGGITGKSKADFGNGTARYIPFLNIMNNVVIDMNNLDSVNISESEGQNQVRKGDLFFNGSSETPEEVGMCSALLEESNGVYLNSFCFGFRSGSDVEVSSLFLAYFFRSGVGRDLLHSLAQGATRYNLSKRNFLNLVFRLPEYSEQKRIAEVLSDMDIEINALETRRAKTQAIKQGMMQELLTGRTRLI